MVDRIIEWFTRMWWTKGWFQWLVIFTSAPLALILACVIWFIPIM